jgi:hypothetical protein
MTNVAEYTKEHSFFHSNIFDHKMLTDEERKMPYQFHGENFWFFCKHTDLLDAPVEVRLTSEISTSPFLENSWEDAYLHDFMNFITDWKTNIWPRLSGYVGFFAVKFEFDSNITFNLGVNNNGSKA